MQFAKCLHEEKSQSWKIYVGPTLVKPLIAKLKRAKVPVYDGTAHIYIKKTNTLDTAKEVLKVFKRVTGVSTGFTELDMQLMPGWAGDYM